MKKILISGLLLLLAFSCENKREKLHRDGEPDVLFVESEDHEMNAAIEKAKETFNRDFQTALESKNPQYSNFAIKQKFNTDNGGEHIWIGDIKFENGKYSGIVQNTPINPIGIQLGDNITINPNEISDWMYYDKNIVKGAYTVKLLRKGMTDEEKKEMDADGLIYE